MQGSAEQWQTDLPVAWFPDEPHLLRAFLQRISELDPDLLIGWNLINFDLDYLERRCRNYRIPFSLGRNQETAAILQPQQSGQPRIASIPGRVALDGIDNLRAAFWSFESFAARQATRVNTFQNVSSWPAVPSPSRSRRIMPTGRRSFTWGSSTLASASAA